MKDSAPHSLLPTFGFAPVDERFQITVGNVSTIPQITLLSSLDWKAAKNGTKKGKTWGEKGRRNDDKRGTKGVRGGAKNGKWWQRGTECGSCCDCRLLQAFCLPISHLIFITPRKDYQIFERGFSFLAFVPHGPNIGGWAQPIIELSKQISTQPHAHPVSPSLCLTPAIFYKEFFMLFVVL